MNRPTALMLACLPALVFTGVTASSPTARAGVPSREASSVDRCAVTCPAGDSAFVVIARWAYGAPFEWGDTVIDFCGCPDLVLAEVPPGGDPYWMNVCGVGKFTTASGVASFSLEAGGLCSEAPIDVYCNGVLLATLTHVASFDQDGDLGVTEADLSQVSGKQGTGDLTADFDCDGDVDATDLAIAAGHVGHAHPSIVGVGDGAPVEFGVRPAPNPTRGPLDFVLRTPTGGHALLAVHDLTGRRLATVLDRQIEPGVHHIPWTGRDAFGRPVPAGLYLYRLRLGVRSTHGALVVTR
jgi:hypothetical protein